MAQTLIAALFYFGFFTVLGYRRGAGRELAVLLASSGALAVLIGFRTPGLSLATWLDLLFRGGAATRMDFLTLAGWLLACTGAYWLSCRYRQEDQQASSVAGALLALVNGLLYLRLLLPWLTRNPDLSTLWPRSAASALSDQDTAGWLVQAPDIAGLSGQIQDWMNMMFLNRTTVIVLLAIGGLVYFLSRTRRSSA